MNIDRIPKSAPFLLALLALLSLSLVAWQTIKPEPPAAPLSPAPVEEIASPSLPPVFDTVPERSRRVRDIDEAIEELDRVDLQKEIIRAQEQASRALQEIDFDKMKLDLQKAMASIDKQKLKQEIQAAIDNVNFDKLQIELAELSDKQKDEIRLSLEKAQIEMERVGPELEKQMKKLREELEKQQPKMEADLKRAKEELKNIQPKLEEAKEEIEKAKADLKEYKMFIDGLDADGLINKKNGYRIEYKNKVLRINGETVPSSKYKKYSSFLEKHPTLEIKKDKEGFNIRNNESQDKD